MADEGHVDGVAGATAGSRRPGGQDDAPRGRGAPDDSPVDQQEAAEHFGYHQELKRTLRFRDLLIYGMVFMVPIAPMGIYGFVAQSSSGMVPTVYLIGIVAMFFTALSYRHMSREFTIAGSVYSYVQRGFNPHIGFLCGWMILADYLLVPALLYRFSATWLRAITPGVPLWVYVVGFILIITVVNVRGISLAAEANFVLLAVELIALALFVVVGLWYVFGRHGGAGGFSLKPFYQSGQMNLSFLATATSLAVLSFLGFDAISTLAEETVHPQRTVGNATVAALFLLGGLFILQTYVASLIHPNYATLDPELGFFDLARQAGGAFLYYTVLIVSIIASGIANALAAQLAVARVLYSISRDGLLPASGLLKKIHPRYRTPANATLFVAVLSVVVALSLGLEQISRFVNFGALTAFMVLHVAVIVHFFVRRRRRDLRGVVLYLVFPIVGLAIIAYVWSGFDRATFVFGFGWLAVGIVLGAWRSKGYRRVPPALELSEG
jgi:amino acid transporter